MGQSQAAPLNAIQRNNLGFGRCSATSIFPTHGLIRPVMLVCVVTASLPAPPRAWYYNPFRCLLLAFPSFKDVLVNNQIDSEKYVFEPPQITRPATELTAKPKHIIPEVLLQVQGI
jgi:hypothetical protein